LVQSPKRADNPALANINLPCVPRNTASFTKTKTIKMPHIILKKTFKIKPAGFQVAAEKSFSLHGAAVTPQVVNALNQSLNSFKTVGAARPIQFVSDQKNGHYTATMNHDFQKYNEEDAIVAILDCMEILGWTFRFQYDSQSSSNKVSGASFTARELFIFSKTM